VLSLAPLDTFVQRDVKAVYAADDLQVQKVTLTRSKPSFNQTDRRWTIAMADNNDISGKGSASGVVAIVIVVFISIALYNVLELNFHIFSTFKKRSGLYYIIIPAPNSSEKGLLRVLIGPLPLFSTFT
jgi:hypothetical protein